MMKDFKEKCFFLFFLFLFSACASELEKPNEIVLPPLNDEEFKNVQEEQRLDDHKKGNHDND